MSSPNVPKTLIQQRCYYQAVRLGEEPSQEKTAASGISPEAAVKTEAEGCGRGRLALTVGPRPRPVLMD